MRKQRSFNFEMGAFGLPGSGKTEESLRRIVAMCRKEQFYVIAHDLGCNIPKKLYDGTETGVIRHKSIAECASSLKSRPSGIHAIDVEDCTEVVLFAKSVARASLIKNTPGGLKAVDDGEGRGIPVIIYIDEIVNAQEASPHRLGDEMRKILTGRRHANCGIVFTSQSPHLCHYALGSQATDILIFRLNDDEDIKRLYKRMNVPRQIAEQAKSLPKHEFIHVQPQKF